MVIFSVVLFYAVLAQGTAILVRVSVQYFLGIFGYLIVFLSSELYVLRSFWIYIDIPNTIARDALVSKP